MVGYALRVTVDWVLIHKTSNSFFSEMLYDWSSLFWDAIPITCILIFHFNNFKPH